MISAAPASVKRQRVGFAEFLLFIHKEHNTISLRMLLKHGEMSAIIFSHPD